MLENYSEEARAALKKAGVRVGDRIVITKKGQAYEGLLMPRTEAGDASAIVIKLENGYNIGIKFEKRVKIEKIASKNHLKEEAIFELGKEGVGKEKTEQPKFSKDKPTLAIISTGGTIASKVDYKTGGVSALEKPEELLTNVPELANIVNVTAILSPFRKMSEDMDAADWKKIAEVVVKELERNEGVLITHGTDTLHFTAAVLSFMLKDLGKPVILVGAQRSPDRGSSDAFMNLICAARAAISDLSGVYICMHGTTNDDYCILTKGTRARKLHTSRRDAFQQLSEDPVAKIWADGKIEFLGEHQLRSEKKAYADVKFESKIMLLKTYPGSDPGLMEWAIKKGYKGFVVEGTGLGHVPTLSKNSWIPVIKKAVKKRLPVIIVSQTLHGRVNPNVYSNLRVLFHNTGAIPGEDMLPEVAYMKLGWVLAHAKNPEEVRNMMASNLAGEITERSEIRVSE